MDRIIIPIIVGLVTLLIGMGIGYIIRKNIAEAKIRTAEEAAAKILIDAKKEAETRNKEALLEAKDEILRLRTEADRENKERRNDIQRQEKRLQQKEESLDKKLETIERQEDNLHKTEQEISRRLEKVKAMHDEKIKELETISGLTTAEAKQILLNSIEDEIRHEAAIMVRDIEQQAKEEGEKRAREVISTAIQRVAADHVSETTVSVVPLPNEEMKGRIIGREGRNIRTLETLTGIDLIIDDTPEAVILSGFDPVRREVARVALEKLILDGRIHPARIEEMVEKSKVEVEKRVWDEGEAATFETGVGGLHPEIIKMLGRLKFRTSYGQNVLQHSVEVAHLAGIMASELGADVTLAKRGGLLHDLGKAIDHEVEGSHVAIGADIAKKFRENDAVIHCIAAHHGDIEIKSIEAALVQAADAISAARPGARRETLEFYIKRLQKLEEIADSFEGVEKSFAIQAGREIRIIVKPDKIDDLAAARFARDIAKKIESELEYPGQIKVVIIRETRVVDYAK
ncbi:MAG: ribonuclease Y [Clostridia bacterium]|nr:ribonuclease Y [Clostridia bacterium]MDD4798117.1 ribonuclease Y [Clostridia bacterium]